MERDFGVELAKMFGARMKRLYELDDTALPDQIAYWLERLRRAEHAPSRPSEQDTTNIGSAADGP